MTEETVYTLDDAMEAGAIYCNRAPGGFERWTDPRSDDPDGQTAWFCPECGCEVRDESEGCEHCGWYTEEEEDDDE